MKKSFFSVFAFLVSGIFLTGCLESPGDVALTASKTTVAVDEEVTLTLSGVENTTCIMWAQSGGPTFVPVNPIGDKATSIKVKFANAGSVIMQATVKNCKKGSDGCTGTCSDVHTEVVLTVN